ncbi:MAG: ATP-binding cassette domain-containing protein [Ignavibacteria bacterium]|nr:ATP-binding cassette domain-containing protein [Ignavibacteria bacterium]
MISIENLTASYSKDKKVIDALNLQLNHGQIHGIVGLNGSGKTTLLNVIYGLKQVDKGSITAYGSNKYRKSISFLETENFFYSNITGREYLRFFKNNAFDCDHWNKLFLLPLDELIDNYSTGMKKKLALLGIIKQDKPIMILDEPFNGLDIETSRIVRTLLLKMKQDKCIIITSHIIETLTNLCDFIHYLEKGKIHFSKNKDEFAGFEKDLFDSIENKNFEIINGLIKN